MSIITTIHKDTLCGTADQILLFVERPMKVEKIRAVVKKIPKDVLQIDFSETNQSATIKFYLDKIKFEYYDLMLDLVKAVLELSAEPDQVTIDFYYSQTVSSPAQTFSLKKWKNSKNLNKINWLDKFRSYPVGFDKFIISLFLHADLQVSGSKELVTQYYEGLAFLLEWVDTQIAFDGIERDIQLLSEIQQKTGIGLEKDISIDLIKIIFNYGKYEKFLDFLNHPSIQSIFTDYDQVQDIFRLLRNNNIDKDIFYFQELVLKSNFYSGLAEANEDIIFLSIKISVFYGDFKNILNYIDKEKLKEFLVKYNHKFNFLHITVYKERFNSFIFLKSLLGEKNTIQDAEGNTLLHICRNDLNWLRIIYDFEYKNINFQNKKGYTALHFAAENDQLEKVQFLLKMGADGTIKDSKGLTFYQIAFERKNNVGMYCYFYYFSKLNTFSGNALALTPMPYVYLQEGPTCGLVAAANVRDHFFNICEDNFRNILLPPVKSALNERKGWYESNVTSLRHLRNTHFDLGGVGEIFSTAKLSRLLNEVECNSVVCKIESYPQFLKTIKVALERNFPLIISFSLSDQNTPDIKGDPKKAHWATIVAMAETNDEHLKCELLVAQYGGYYKFDAFELYTSNQNLPASFPGAAFSKDEHTKEWKDAPQPPQKMGKYYVVEKCPMDIGGKLVIATPKNTKLDLTDTDIVEYCASNNNFNC